MDEAVGGKIIGDKMCRSSGEGEFWGSAEDE
jgi:hypothetical protein